MEQASSSSSSSSSLSSGDESSVSEGNFARGKDRNLENTDDSEASGSDVDKGDDDDDDARGVPESFDDLPSDDSVGVSSSSDDSGDDSGDGNGDGEDENDDMAVGERLLAKRRMGARNRKSLMKSKAEAKQRALTVASKRLAAMRQKKDTRAKKTVSDDDFFQEDDGGAHSSSGEGEDDDNDDDDSLPTKKSKNEGPSSTPPTTTTNKKKRRKKSKHRPTEASSKRSDYFSRGAPDLNSSGLAVSVGSNRYRARDPRFQSLSGHYDANSFDRKYEFLEDVREEEIQTLKKRIAAWKKPGRSGQRARRKLGLTAGGADGSLEEDQARLGRLMQNLAEKRKDQIQRAAKSTVKKRIREDVADGKRGAYYLKRNEQRRLEVEAQFDELRKRGGNEAVDKAIAKRRRRVSAKDKRYLPRMD